MPKADVLDLVTADLSRGRTHPAAQRLASLVAAHPTDLDLRRRLAALHLATGNLTEAGRWSYLHEDADAAAIAAFQRAYPAAAHRLRALRWPGTADLAPTGYARGRLTELARDTAAPVRPAPGARRTRLARPWYRTGGLAVPRPGELSRRHRVLAATLLAVATGFAVVGATTVIGWLVG